MKKWFGKILCAIGIHKKENKELLGEINYDVCVRCSAGHPLITGEW